MASSKALSLNPLRTAASLVRHFSESFLSSVHHAFHLASLASLSAGGTRKNEAESLPRTSPASLRESSLAQVLRYVSKASASSVPVLTTRTDLTSGSPCESRMRPVSSSCGSQ